MMMLGALMADCSNKSVNPLNVLRPRYPKNRSTGTCLRKWYIPLSAIVRGV